MHDIARAAVLDVADLTEHVGEWIDDIQLDEVVVVRFASLHPGYPHWHWSVALVPSADGATINEVWMEPGEGALTVPAWKPWSERVRPGDLGAGDVIPTDPTDSRLAPGYTAEDLPADVEQLEPREWEPGLGRARVLSVEGFAAAVDRWRSGDDGPESQIARLADMPCSTCAWLLPIGGLLGQAFGVCAHDMSPSDGHVVSLDHGCGAHSDVVAEPTPVPVTDLVIDETRLLPLRLDRSEAPAPADDMLNAEETDDHASEGNVTPPEDVVLDEGLVEDAREQSEDTPDAGADNAGTDAIEVQSL